MLANFIKRFFPVVRYEEGEQIIKQGDKANEMYIIQSGEVRIFSQKDHHVVELGIREKEDFVGEMGLFEGERTASVIANSPTELFKISKQEFWKLLEKDKDFREELIQKLVTELVEANRLAHSQADEIRELRKRLKRENM